MRYTPEPAVATSFDWVVAVVVVMSILALGVASVRGPTAAIIALVASVGAIAVAARADHAGTMVLAAVPATSGLLRGGVLPVVKVSEGLLLFGAALVLVLRPSNRRLRWSRLDTSIIGFAVVSVLVGAYHQHTQHGGLSAAIQVSLRPFFLFLIYRTVAASIRSERQLLTALRVAVLTTVPVSVLALLQYVNVPGMRRLLLQVVGGSNLMPRPDATGAVRATGPFPIWHSLDGYLLPLLLLVIALLLSGRQQVLSARWLWLVLAIDLGAVVASLTLAMGVGLVGGVLVLGLLYRRLTRVVVGMIGLGILGTVVFLPALELRYRQQFGPANAVSPDATPQTFSYRLQIWHDQYLPYVEAHPLLGFGNRLPSTAAFQHTDNEYLTLLLRGGGVLVLAVLVMVAGVTVAGARLYRTSTRPEPRALGAAVAVSAICPIVMGIIWPYITDAGFGETWLGLAGVVAACSIRPELRPARRAAVGPPPLPA